MKHINVFETAGVFTANVNGKAIEATSLERLQKLVALHLGAWDENSLSFNLDKGNY